MKTKPLDRRHWIGITDFDYSERRMDIEDFHGLAALMTVKSVSKPTFWGDVKVIDVGMRWLEFIEDGSDCLVTAMMTENGEIVHWYIDMIDSYRCEDGVTWVDDIYLDLQLSTDGRQRVYDRDELDTALESGDITRTQYDRTLDSMERLLAVTADYPKYKAKCEKLYKQYLNV